MIVKTFFPVGVPGAIQIPIEGLKVNASAAGVFIEDGNLRGLTHLFEGMRIPLIHYPEAARQIAIRALAFSEARSIGRDMADYLAAGDLLNAGNLLEACRLAAEVRPGAAKRLIDFTDIHDEAFAELIRHSAAGNTDALSLLARIPLASTWRRRTHILEALARSHGVAFDLWLWSALKTADAGFKSAILDKEDILVLLAASPRSAKTLGQAAALKDKEEPGWDDPIVRHGPKILAWLLRVPFPATSRPTLR